MEILKNFGFEPVFFIAQIVNFLILFFVFKRFLYKPILKLLKERAREITKGLEDADNAKKTLEDAEKAHARVFVACPENWSSILSYLRFLQKTGASWAGLYAELQPRPQLAEQRLRRATSDES